MRLRLEFTPLEFETYNTGKSKTMQSKLEFTPLEFETSRSYYADKRDHIRIYSVGV